MIRLSHLGFAVLLLGAPASEVWQGAANTADLSRPIQPAVSEQGLHTSGSATPTFFKQGSECTTIRTTSQTDSAIAAAQTGPQCGNQFELIASVESSALRSGLSGISLARAPPFSLLHS